MRNLAERAVWLPILAKWRRVVREERRVAGTAEQSKEPGEDDPGVDSEREAVVIHKAYERQTKTFRFSAGQRRALNAKKA